MSCHVIPFKNATNHILEAVPFIIFLFLSHCSCARFSLIQGKTLETLLPFLSHVCSRAVVLAIWSSTNTGQSSVRMCWGLPVGQDTRSSGVFPWGPDVLVSVTSRLCLARMLTAALCKKLIPASLLPPLLTHELPVTRFFFFFPCSPQGHQVAPFPFSVSTLKSWLYAFRKFDQLVPDICGTEIHTTQRV